MTSEFHKKAYHVLGNPRGGGGFINISDIKVSAVCRIKIGLLEEKKNIKLIIWLELDQVTEEPRDFLAISDARCYKTWKTCFWKEIRMYFFIIKYGKIATTIYIHNLFINQWWRRSFRGLLCHWCKHGIERRRRCISSFWVFEKTTSIKKRPYRKCGKLEQLFDK